MATARAVLEPPRKSASDRASALAPLRRLFEQWDHYRDAVPLDRLARGLKSLALTAADFGGYVIFGRDCYRRNRIHAGKAYEALLLCWAPGQRSPIHDHHGSACALRIIEGVATETRFEFSPCGLIYPVQTARLTAGAVTASYDTDIHQMGNLQSGRSNLITLHIYSPPLRRMGRYYLGDSVLGEGDEALRARVIQRAARRRPPAVADALARLRRRVRSAGMRQAASHAG